MGRHKVAGTPADPTLPKVKLTLDQKEYTLCLDLNALAAIEQEMIAAGQEVNILQTLPRYNLSSVRIMFLAGLRRFHPELTLSDMERMFTFANFPAITAAVTTAYTSSKPETDADPSVADAHE